MKFHGEYMAVIKVEVVVEANDLESAQNAVKGLDVDMDGDDTVMVLGWDVEPRNLDLFEGEE